MRRSLGQLFLLWGGLFLLAGCAGPGNPVELPTQMPLAILPVTPTAAPLPPTFTPIASGNPITTLTSTATIAPTPSPTLTPTETPTPVPIPHYLVNGIMQPPFLEHPPGSVACSGRGVLFRSRYPSEFGGPWRYYTAYLPSCYGQQGRSYPVLYLFHGSIQNDFHWVDLGLVQYVDAGIARGKYAPFIVIMPDNGELGNLTSGGERSIEGITINALLPAIDAAYCTWNDRVGRSIGGISRGGYWALMIAFRHPHLFAAVSGHSSHLRYETDKAEYNPLSTFATADLSAMRIWLDWGEKDFLYYGQKTLHESLVADGISHDVRLNPGGHNEQYWRDHIADYLDWHAASWPLESDVYPPCLGN